MGHVVRKCKYDFGVHKYVKLKAGQEEEEGVDIPRDVYALQL